MFFSGEFIQECIRRKYLEKILKVSILYLKSWPDYNEYSCDEAILPSLAYSFGKAGYCLNRKCYGVRYRPEWQQSDDVSNLELLHPIKQ
jgi:hypothetical protein